MVILSLQGNIDAAINSMQCACGTTTIANVGAGEFREIKDGNDVVCCGKRSSHSTALRRLSDTIFPAARPSTTLHHTIRDSDWWGVTEWVGEGL